jgi:hypothetical protein
MTCGMTRPAITLDRRLNTPKTANAVPTSAGLIPSESSLYAANHGEKPPPMPTDQKIRGMARRQEPGLKKLISRAPAPVPSVLTPMAVARPVCGMKSRISVAVPTREIPSAKPMTQYQTANCHLVCAVGTPN